MKIKLSMILLVVLLSVLPGSLLATSSANYNLSTSLTPSGGGEKVSTSFSLKDTIGEPMVGEMGSANFKVKNGFWYSIMGAPAPAITSITPNYGLNNGSVSITNLSGTGFQAGATVKLVKAGFPDIVATNVVVVSPTQITCQFNFAGTEWGYYGVVVINTDGQSGTLPRGFIIRTQPATITGLTPGYGVVNTSVNIVLTGSGFISSSTIKMQKTGQPDIVATSVTINPTSVTGTFNLTGVAIGSWGITVVNPDNQTSSFGPFTVTMPTTEITIGQGTQSIEYLMGTNVHDRRVQVIYLASEIGKAGAISALALNVATPPGATLNNWTIRMRHFTQSAESGIWIVAGAWFSTVYQGNEPPGTSGWRVFNFSEPFNYNGSQNLEIDFSFNNSAVGSASGTCFYSIPVSGSNRTLFGASNSANGDPLTWSGTTPLATKSDIVPNIRLTMGSIGGYNLTVNVSPSGSGIVNYNGGTFEAGSQLNLVAQANVGWVFDHWGGNATGTNPNIFLAMDSNKTVTAYFRAVQNTITISKTVGGSVTTPGEGAFTYNYGQQVSLVAVPDTGYRFVNWTGDISTMADYTAASTTITIGGNYSIVANFARITCQLTINIQGNGSTDPVPGVYPYNQGSQAQVTAIPSNGSVFSHWSGDESGTANPLVTTISSNKNITANFALQGNTLIGLIKQDPAAFNGLTVRVSGSYRGWQSGFGSPPVTRSDWVVQDDTGTIYVTGSSQGLKYPMDAGKPVIVNGVVRLKNGLLYIEIPQSGRR